VFLGRARASLKIRAEMLDHRRGKVAKQRVIAQQSQLVTRAFRRPLAAWNRHESSPVTNEYCLRSRTRPRQPVCRRLDSSGDTIAHGYGFGAFAKRTHSLKKRSP